MKNYVEAIFEAAIASIAAPREDGLPPLPVDLDTLTDEELVHATALIQRLTGIVEYAIDNVQPRLRGYVLSVAFEEVAREEGVLVDTSQLFAAGTGGEIVS
jgi:hypothetical protein